MTELYYQAPSDKIFEEVKAKATEVWQTYDNEFGYVDEKVGGIKDLKNISDNIMTIVAMFDSNNQERLAQLLSPAAKKAIADRIKDGGTPDFMNFFL